ncbi:hypothetical protein C8J55DRAFT_562537 [Lentinula edodes]|uniref:F-box domain-containing protein n=1 Tax=Lentinula lateritia TaxID=40482 RepID=A0A9W9DL24_9AGAR|nr:hypothetical protein C8J55DRAFT_562537 [Lentinula edodes]
MSIDLPGFPNEILAVIASYLTDDKGALYSFSLSCKHFAAVATPILYHSVPTLGLPTLASDDLLLSSVMGRHPACFARDITVSVDDKEEIMRVSLGGALFNIEHDNPHYTPPKHMMYLHCAKANVLLHSWCNISIYSAQQGCRVPLDLSLCLLQTSYVLKLLSCATESIRLDWSQVVDPPSYMVIANFFALLPTRLQNLQSLELNIPPLVDNDDISTIQVAFNSKNMNFPFLTRFVFGNIFGDISLSSFLQHPGISTLGYCGIINDPLVVDQVRSGRLLTNVPPFVGGSDLAVVIAGVLSTKLTVLTLDGPAAVVLFGDVACHILQTCYWLHELHLPSPTGYNAHELQTISNYVPGLAALSVTFRDCESGPNVHLLRSCTPCNRAKATRCLSAEDEWDSSEVINNTAVTPLVPGDRE